MEQPDDQTLKMEALKKAYAEIILNTSKEAAARAMASERKALRFQYDLRNTKDEALRMLLRFKHMIDSKTSETEKANLGQQKRIEELDAQLNEAEGVIVDLRAELRNAYERLEEMKNKHMLQSSGPSANEDVPRENTTRDKKLDVIEGLDEMKNSHMLPSNGASENEQMDQEKTAHDKKLDVTGGLEERKTSHMLPSNGASENEHMDQEKTAHDKKLDVTGRLEERKTSHTLPSNGASENEHMDQEKTAHDKKLDVTGRLEERKTSHTLPSNGASENEHMDQEKTADDKKLDVTGRLEEMKNNHMLQSTGPSESNCVHQENTALAKKLYIAKRLEETKKNHMQQSHGPSENEQTHQENTSLDKKLAISDHFKCSSQSGKCCTRAKEPATSVPKLASIINGNREPESYRNGCTQRIRAIERILMDEKSISKDKHDMYKKVSGKSVPASFVAEITDTKSINRPEAVSINSSVVKDQAVKIKRLPRNRVRYAKSKHKVSRFCNAPSTKSTKRTEKLNLKENTRGEDEKLTGTNEHGACGIRRSIRKRKLRCWDEISSLFKSRTALSRCKKYSGNDGVNFDEHQYRSKFTDVSKETKCDVDGKLVDLSAVGKHEVAAKSAGVSSCNSTAKAEKVLKADSEQAGNTDKSRHLKYTFSRKRKNVLLSKSDNCSSLEKTLLTRENEKLNVIDDSNDSKNLVEVACQLISLSGERSW